MEVPTESFRSFSLLSFAPEIEIHLVCGEKYQK